MFWEICTKRQSQAPTLSRPKRKLPNVLLLQDLNQPRLGQIAALHSPLEVGHQLRRYLAFAARLLDFGCSADGGSRVYNLAVRIQKCELLSGATVYGGVGAVEGV